MTTLKWSTKPTGSTSDTLVAGKSCGTYEGALSTSVVVFSFSLEEFVVLWLGYNTT